MCQTLQAHLLQAGCHLVLHGALQSLEQRFPDWCQGLARLALKAQQRDLWVRPAALTWRFEESDLLLSFGLPAGSFATSLLREIVDYGER